MGKVKGEDKFPNEVVATNRRRKKRKKELDLLRRNVLEAKRKLSRKPQVGIFANGAKGAEIKRVNLSLNESDKARFEGDLQKVLGDGVRKCKPSAEAVDMEAQGFIRIPEKRLERKPVQNFTTERQSGKRKLQVPIESDGKTAKKPHSEMEITKVVVQYDKVKSDWKNLTEKKWKKSLFQNEVDDFGPMVEPDVEQLRFSPTIGKAKAEAIPSEPKVVLDVDEERPGTKILNSNYGQLGRLAATKYNELCAMVRAENFDTCLQEIPHIDPLTKVKQSLINFYTETCNQKVLQNKVRSELLFAEESSSASSYLVNSNIHETKYFDQDGYLERSKLDRTNVLPPQRVCLGNLKKLSHREAPETSSGVRSKPLMMKAPEVNKSNNISRVKRGPPSPETIIIKRNTSSLDANYHSPRKSFRSDVIESLKIDDEARPPVVEPNGAASPRLAGIPSHRRKTMLRYLKEVKNVEPPKKEGAICPLESSATSQSSENKDVQKYYIGDPLRRHEMRTKQTRNVPERKLGDIRGTVPFETNIAEYPRNLLDIDNCQGVKTRLGLDPRNLPKVEERARPTVVNLGSASRSTLDRIPSDRGEFMLRYLQDVKNSERRKEVFVVDSENAKHQKRRIDDPLRRREVKNTPGKNERHVPAILRKSQAAKRDKKSNTADTIVAKGVLEIGNLRWKSSNFKFQKISSESEATTVNSSSGKSQSSIQQPTKHLFPIDCENSTDPERLNFLKNVSQYPNQAPPPETPTVVKALYDLNEEALNIKRNFMNEIFAQKSATEQENIPTTSEDVNFPVDFNPQSLEFCCHQSYTDNVTISNFHEIRQPQNSPIHFHQQRSRDARVHRVVCDENMVSSLGDHESQRFPVFLKRKAASSTQNRSSYEEQHQGRMFPEKVIVVRSPTLGESSKDFRHEINVPQMTSRNTDPSLQANCAGLAFPKYPRGMQMASLKPVQLQNGRQKVQQFQAPDSSFHNLGQQAEQLQIPRCGCETDLKSEQHVRLPSIVYQNGMRKVVNHKYTVQELGNNPVNFFEPTNFDVSTSQRMFQRDPSSNAQIPASYGSSYCGNSNFEFQYGCGSAEPVQFSSKRIGFVIPKNGPELFCQNVTELPIIRHQIPHRENHSSVSTEDKNHNYKYVIDPRYPQAGYQWNQIDQSGAQVHQRVIQPAYNVTDAYRPQIPHSYFSTDT